MEIRPYPKNPNYGVTRCGRIFRIVKAPYGRRVPHELAQTFNKHTGYLFVGAGRRKGTGLFTTPVHQMVAETWIEKPPGEKLQVCHWDNDRLNNNAENLRWGTPTENQGDRVRHGTRWQGTTHRQAKLTEADIPKIRSDPRPDQEIADDYGVCRSRISSLQRGEGWTHV